jgi:hypothetical protein
MDDGVIVREVDRELLLLEELLQMLPVVELFVLLEGIVVLIHLDLVGVVPREDFSEDPPVREVALRVRYLVRQVQRLQPQVQLTRKGYHLYS